MILLKNQGFSKILRGIRDSVAKIASDASNGTADLLTGIRGRNSTEMEVALGTGSNSTVGLGRFIW